MDIDKYFINLFHFITENSKDITCDLLIYAIKSLNRKNALNKLSKYINILDAIEIEKGIFEFSLITVTINNFDYSLIVAIYQDKLNDMCANLDPTNKKINNKTLIESTKTKNIKPFFISFLSPEQLNPEKWNDLLEKRRIKEETESNISTTDTYKCYKCGERKCRVTKMQLRCVDEPMTTFITCMVCHNTWTK